MLKSKEYLSHDENDTLEIAKELSKILTGNCVLYLVGDVGAGKTFFISALCKHFRVYDICSSSFSKFSIHNGIKQIIHCDFYNCENIDSLIENEIEPSLSEPWILIIEWPNALLELNFDTSFHIQIIKKGIKLRKFIVNQIKK
jgi:tRNA threonylcarbamoyladenosine biosynthesis protein TsaE